MSDRWADYVTDITARASQREIAVVSGIEKSVVSRWLSGTRPRAEQAIKFARAYGRPPIEALIAADYLSNDDAEAEPPVNVRALGELSNAELVAAFERDWRERRRGAAHFEAMMRELFGRLLNASEQ